MPGPIADFPCPRCGGQCWDNRNDPNRKPNQPLVKCKNKNGCGWAVWDLAKIPASSAPAPSAQSATPAPRRPPLVIEKVMDVAMGEAVILTNKHFVENGKPTSDFDLVLRTAAIMAIARLDGKGIFGIEKEALEKAAKKRAELEAEAKRKAAEAEAARLEQERARQASQPQVGPGAAGELPPPMDPEYGWGGEELPF